MKKNFVFGMFMGAAIAVAVFIVKSPDKPIAWSKSSPVVDIENISVCYPLGDKIVENHINKTLQENKEEIEAYNACLQEIFNARRRP